MHHCNIMYPSCDTIYTGVMLNVEITRTDLLLFMYSPVLSHRTTNDIRYFVKLIKPCDFRPSCDHTTLKVRRVCLQNPFFLYEMVERIRYLYMKKDATCVFPILKIKLTLNFTHHSL